MSDQERPADNPAWRETLLGTHPQLVRLRRIMRHVPSDPRCKLCLSPQGGIGAPIVRLLGYGRYPRNPQLCNSCYRASQQYPGGAVIDLAALFADVRGSTGLAERMPPDEYSAAVGRYLEVASQAIRRRDGVVSKLLGDGVMALFLPGFVGGDHVGSALAAAREILGGVSLPVGVGVHAGDAWVGFVGGLYEVLDFTALGDAVNVASRLGSEADAGELLISAATTTAAGIATDGLEHRRLELRGREEPLDAWSERVSAEAPA